MLETKEDVLLPCVWFFAEYGELPGDIDEETSKGRFACKLPPLYSLSSLGQSLGGPSQNVIILVHPVGLARTNR